MPVPESYHEEILEAISPNDFRLFHWAKRDRFLIYLQNKAILSKGTMWGTGQYTSNASTLKIDAELGFIDYVYFGVCNWPALRMRSYYGYYGIEISFQSIKEREYFAYPFNTGNTWYKMSNDDKRSDLSTLIDRVWNKPTQRRTAEVIVRRKVKLTDQVVTAIHMPDQLDHEIDAAVLELGINENKVKRFSMTIDPNNTMSNARIRFSNRAVFDVELPETDFGPEKFVLDPSDRTIVYFHIPNSSSVVALKRAANGELTILDTNHVVGKITP